LEYASGVPPPTSSISGRRLAWELTGEVYGLGMNNRGRERSSWTTSL
jgi:hypothetical protein